MAKTLRGIDLRVRDFPTSEAALPASSTSAARAGHFPTPLPGPAVVAQPG
jgi:hypothetical protein